VALQTGLQTTITHTVAEADTAIAVGSGSLPVLGTPRLVAWCEAATVAAISAAIDPTQTTVGTNVNIDHLAPTRVGGEISATATLDAIDGRRLTFSVTALEGDNPIGSGTITRALVDIERFMASTPSR